MPQYPRQRPRRPTMKQSFRRVRNTFKYPHAVQQLDSLTFNCSCLVQLSSVLYFTHSTSQLSAGRWYLVVHGSQCTACLWGTCVCTYAFVQCYSICLCEHLYVSSGVAPHEWLPWWMPQHDDSKLHKCLTNCVIIATLMLCDGQWSYIVWK